MYITALCNPRLCSCFTAFKFQQWTSSLTQDGNTFSKYRSSGRRGSRCGSSTSSTRCRCGGADRNRQVLAFVTTIVGAQQLEFSRRSWVGVLVKERQVQHSLNRKKNRFDHCGLRKFINMNNCHTKDFQHKNYPIYSAWRREKRERSSRCY